jgi:hypothetical protein
MPQSKHRRHGKSRPRAHETHAPERKPDPSPPWVPVTAAALLLCGVAVILLGYLPLVSDRTASWVWLGSNWGLVIGFVLLSIGFGFLSRWR